MKSPLGCGFAPSPLVLGFLRRQVKSAFEPQSGAWKSQSCAFGSLGRTRGAAAGRVGSWQCRGGRTVTTSKCLVARRPGLAHTGAFECAPGHGETRGFSTTRVSGAWGMFNAAKRRGLAQPQPPLDENAQGGSGFGSSLGRMTRATNELKMRCTELDEHGNVTLVSGEFKKSELIAKVRLTTIECC